MRQVGRGMTRYKLETGMTSMGQVRAVWDRYEQVLERCDKV